MTRTRFEISDVIARYADEFTSQCRPNAFQQKTLHALSLCRTAQLGGHKEQCNCCKKTRISYNSCRNRHCPKCQSSRQAFWVEDLMNIILPVKHYHVVFTVPQQLNALCMSDSRWFYNQLFESVWDTLQSFGITQYGVESGAVCVLHTWGQNLYLHPHIHCIVPAAGVTLAGNAKHIGKGGKYLYPVTQLSTVFRAKMMQAITRMLKNKSRFSSYINEIENAWKKPWVVFCEPSLSKPQHVVNYLGQYTHRVAISNHRLLKVDNEGVTFLHKDYAHGAKQKPITLSGVEFLRRFCQHMLPLRFVKIRYYGIYSSRFRTLQKKAENKIILKPLPETVQQRILRLTGFDVYQCPFCKKGTMHVVEVLPRVRSPTRKIKNPVIEVYCF